ncbi:MAG: HNH endonuclease [Adhaeribacter sp.]
MVRLNRLAKPIELTAAIQTQLTDEFKTNGTSVWKQKYIERDLLKMSYEKCCYCECKLNEESKYLEIEHFYPKNTYKDQVVEWENLLPSCKRCNGKKSDLNPSVTPIINPTLDNPQSNIYLQGYRLYKITDKGDNTIEELDLNNRSRLVNRRYEIGCKIAEQLEAILEKAKEYHLTSTKTNRNKNKLVSIISELMKEGHRDSQYSAVAATLMLINDNFKEIKQIMVLEGLWSNELENSEKELYYCALPTSKLNNTSSF